MGDVEAIRGAAIKLYQACRAHRAWQIAESEHPSTTSFHERMDLCNYAEWLTCRALDAVAGRETPDHVGVPQMIVWPEIELHRASAEDCRQLVDRLLCKEPTP